MNRASRSLTALALGLGLTLAWSVAPAIAASSWWVAAPNSARALSTVASNQGPVTLAISQGVAGRYSPATGEFLPLSLPSGQARGFGSAVAVAATGRLGLVAYHQGQVVEVGPTGKLIRLPSVPGIPAAVAVSGPSPALLAVATSNGLFSGEVGTVLTRVTPGNALAVVAPPLRAGAWLALVAGRLWVRASGGGWALDQNSPQFDPQTTAVTEFPTGVILVGEPGGLIWRGSGGNWARAFQVLPYGGLGGVPAVTSLVADGATSAYVGTDGFGTLLTPDGGYTWYRAPPANEYVSRLAVVGPVFSGHPHGLVVALTSGGVFLHRLQALPEPPVYRPPSANAELGGTAAVTVGCVLLVTLLLWLLNRRRRQLSV